MRPVLVTGAAGTVGQHVVRWLLSKQIPVVACGQSTERLHARFGAEVAVRPLDFHDPRSWTHAAEGTSHVFLMRPPAISDVRSTLVPFIEAARAGGCEHVVFLSVAGADKNRFVPHRAVEEELRSADERFTLLRPGFFAQNLETAYRADILEDDRIYVPAGRHEPVNFIDARDIGEVAGLVLQQPDAHRGAAYTLTGPGPVHWTEVAQTLSRVAGRSIRYQPASILGYMTHLARRGRPRGAILVQTILHVLLRFGQGAIEDPSLARLLGRSGRSIRSYIEDHAHLWRSDDSPPFRSAQSAQSRQA